MSPYLNLFWGCPDESCFRSPWADANGKAVVPADVEARPVPLPDSIAVPIGNNRGGAPGQNQGRNHARPGRSANPVTLGGDSTYIAIDGRKLEPLVNPPPCTPVR